MTNYQFASEDFRICTHTTSLTFDLISDQEQLQKNRKTIRSNAPSETWSHKDSGEEAELLMCDEIKLDLSISIFKGRHHTFFWMVPNMSDIQPNHGVYIKYFSVISSSNWFKGGFIQSINSVVVFCSVKFTNKWCTFGNNISGGKTFWSEGFTLPIHEGAYDSHLCVCVCVCRVDYTTTCRFLQETSGDDWWCLHCLLRCSPWNHVS